MERYTLEVALTWAGVGAYLLAIALLASSVVFGAGRARTWGLVVGGAGLVPHGAAIVIRWAAVGHGPYMLKYEVLSSNAWVAVLVLLGLAWRRPAWTAVSVAALPLAILSVALGLFSNPESRELPPSLRSIWLVFHVIFAKVSAAAFLVSLGASITILLRQGKARPRWADRLPPDAALDAVSVRAVGFGLIFWTFTIAAGAIWGSEAWGRYWGWDPIETWSLVAWLTYGAFLHLRLFHRPGVRATAWLSVAAFGIFILALLILPFFISSLHSSYFS